MTTVRPPHAAHAVSRPEAIPSARLRPFIRWAGSKRLLLGELLPLVPAEFGTYFEPFLGGGSLFLAVMPQKARLGDALEPLVNAWRSIKVDPSGVLEAVERWSFDRETYDRLKRETLVDDIERAAQFLYLNRGAYGGLWRLNRSGEFNVPWSTPKTESALDNENVRRVATMMNSGDIELILADFAVVTAGAVAGDFVFFDPPYSKGRPERPFIHYNEALFDWSAQERLALEAHRLRALGTTVLVTNSTHPDVAALYADFEQIDVKRHSSLGSHTSSSRNLTERIFFSR